MLRPRQNLLRKPNPGELVLDAFGREYRVTTVGSKYLYAIGTGDRNATMFHILQVRLKPAVAPPPPQPTIDEEFLA